jgi:hypothetical protein
MKVEIFMQVIGDDQSGTFNRKLAVRSNHYVRRFSGKDAEDAKRQASKFFTKLKEAMKSARL